MAFNIAAGLAALNTVIWIVRPIVLARRASKGRAAHDEQVFRDQLLEIERDRERGLLNSGEANAARLEISRRLLSAAAEREASPDHQPAPRLVSYGLAALLVLAAPIGGWSLYTAIGAPGLPDQPHAQRAAAERTSQKVAEAELARRFGAAPEAQDAGDFSAMIAQLQARLEGPDPDPEGLRLLAQSQARIGRHADAWRTWERLIATRGDEATAAMFSSMAEEMILAAQGYVSPQAETALTEALRRAPTNPIARYYMGAALAQTGRATAAFEAWSSLIADSPEGAPWLQATRAQIVELAERTGRPAPPMPQPRAPSARERAAMAADMAAQIERGVSARDAPTGEWLQLVLAYDQLGQADASEDAARRAREAMDARPTQRNLFEAALAAAPRATGVASLQQAVEQLEERLARQTQDAAAWLRLVASNAALGRFDAAREAAMAARDALAGAPDRLGAFTTAIGGDVAIAELAPESAARGPTAQDVEMASEMTDEERADMIRGMVEGLRARLYEDGGPPEDWARLIQALGVLGDGDAATEAFQRARAAFSGDPVVVSALAERAILAGAELE